tara:strand:+ start:45896 stop:46195 length:300 start_codon:yes stop_codon:yes gene_type:complete
MIFIWIIYLALTILISYLLCSLTERRLFKILIFSFVFSIFATFWFKTPGENFLSPVFSIFLLESLILENNGFLRIFRPFILTFLITYIFSLFLWKKTKI